MYNVSSIIYTYIHAYIYICIYRHCILRPYDATQVTYGTSGASGRDRSSSLGLTEHVWEVPKNQGPKIKPENTILAIRTPKLGAPTKDPKIR